MNKHISSNERYQIQAFIDSGISIQAIADKLGRHKSTIHREINRNAGGNGYLAHTAQQRAQRRAKCSRNAKRIAQRTWQAVAEHLIDTDSPEQIAQRYGISHQAIYNYVDRDRRANGCWWLFLRSQKPYKKRCGVAGRPGKIPNRRPLSERPARIEQRAQVGDIEADSIVGPNHASSILAAVDRKSGYLWAGLLADRSAASAHKVMVDLLAPVACCIKTVTTDNGGEFALHEQLDEALGCTSYFCDPYCSWQRGTNENTNGLIRQFLPKSRDLSSVTQDELSMIVGLINNRPRKRLGFKTPAQVFMKSFNRRRTS